jgi:hypothetical protein
MGRMDDALRPSLATTLEVIFAAEALVARMTQSRDVSRAEWERDREGRQCQDSRSASSAPSTPLRAA